jgi:SAM-dependent methyltransferase
MKMLPNFADLASLDVVREIAPHDRMFDPSKPAHYFGVGMSNLYLLINIMRIRAATVGEIPVQDILDFGCGCGRVARFIRAAFPESRLWVTDLRREDVDWCVSKLGCHQVVGEVELHKYDLIWLGSVFTHLPKEPTLQLMRRLHDALKPCGVLAFSTHGRYCIERLKSVDWSHNRDRATAPYGLDRPAVETVIKGYTSESYGYVDSPDQTGYGITVATPEWYMSSMRNTADATQIFFQERGNDDHQDVFAFLHRPIGAPWTMEFVKAARNFVDGPTPWVP